MHFFQAVETYPEDMCGNIQRQRAVGRYRDAQEALSGLLDKIVQTIGAFPPQQRFAAFKNDDAGSEMAQTFQCPDCRISGHAGIFIIRTQMKRTGPAIKGDTHCQQTSDFMINISLTYKTNNFILHP